MLNIIGLGNRLRGDDGIGPKIIDRLSEIETGLKTRLVDLGSDAFTVLEYLLEKDPVLIIDCARMGREPGHICSIPIDAENLQIAENTISLHGFSLAEVILLANKTGDLADGKIIAIEPGEMEFNTGLSREIENKLDELIRFVIEEANYYGKKNLNN